MTERKKDACAMAAIVAASVLFAWPYLFRRGVFLGADAQHFLYPIWHWQIAHRASLGALLWTDQVGFGYPFGVMGYVNWACPISAIVTTLPLDPYRGFALRTMIGIALAGVATYLFARASRLVRPAAVLGGIAYCLGRFFVNWSFFVGASNAWIAMPLLLLFLLKASQGDRRWFIAAAFAVGFALSTSGAPNAATILVAGGLYALWLSIRRRDRGGTVAGFVIAVVAGALMSLHTLLPAALDLMPHVIRAKATAWPLSHAFFITYSLGAMISPILERANPTVFYVPFYVGFVTLVLAIEAIRRRRTMPLVTYLLLVALAGFLLFFIPATPLIHVWQRLPGAAVFGLLARAAILPTFAIALLGGVGLHAIMTGADKAPWFERVWRFIRLPVAVALCLWVVAALLVPRIFDLDYLATHRTRSGLLHVFSLRSADAWVFFASLCLAGVLLRKRDWATRRGLALAWVVVAVVAADLLVTSRGAYNVRVGTVPEGYASETAAFIDQDKGLFRIYTLNETGGSLALTKELGFLSDEDAMRLFFQYRQEALSANVNMTYDLSHARVGTTVPMKRPFRVYGFVEGSAHPLPEDPAAETIEDSVLAHLKILSLFNVKYLTATRELDHPDLTLRHTARVPFAKEGVVGTIPCYENAGCLPRAFLVRTYEVAQDDAILPALDAPDFDVREAVLVESDPEWPTSDDDGPVGEARIVSWSPTRIEITTDAPASRCLFVSQTFFPGWSAEVDGEPVAIAPANVAGIALSAPAGEHRVVLSYHPRHVYLGAAVSGAVALALILLATVRPLAAVVGLVRSRRPAPPQED